MSHHPKTFADRVVAFYDANKRDLPWRLTRDPYAIWISEIMCQQTRVHTAIPYFNRWLKRFPNITTLAAAELDDVLSHWSGLGYYSRARNIHKAARELVADHGGCLPDSVAELRRVPGIGRYTAGAIASIAFGESEPLVDGNVARVLARAFAIDDNIKTSKGQQRLWQQATALVPKQRAGDYNQGLMELGATVCTPRNPQCTGCPLSGMCQAQAAGRQRELPVVPRRQRSAEKMLLARSALWNQTRAGILLGHRHASGLYGGLWELPQTENARDFDKLVGCRVDVGKEPSLVHEQELSHRRLRISVLEGQLEGRYKRPSATSDYHLFRRFRPAQMVDLGRPPQHNKS